MSLAVDQTRNLLDLRFLHERGVQEIRHPTPGRRAVGVILLDAANERAVFDAATTRALPIKRELDAQVSALATELGNGWGKSGLTTVLRLHKARNGVQHQGLGIDPTSIEQWIAASRGFIDDVIKAVYNVSIWTMTAADAIVTLKWADLLRAGEYHSSSGRYSEAIKSYAQLFAELDRGLGGLRTLSTGIMRPFGNDILDKKTYEFLDRRIEESARLSWFSNISVDSFELQWFENLIREMRWASKEDADRAHALIFWAVTAFEAIVPSVRPGRRQKWELSQRACRPTGPDIPARIVSHQIIQQSESGLRVEVHFADVPRSEVDFNSWVLGVTQAIRTGNGVSFPSIDGTAALRFSLVYQDSYESLAALLQSAIAAGERAIQSARAEMADRSAREQEIKDRLAPSITAHAVPSWVSEQVISFSDRASDGHNFPVVLLSISDSVDGYPFDRSLWRFVHDRLDGVQFFGTADQRYAFSPVERWSELSKVLQEFDDVHRQRCEQQDLAAAERARSAARLNAAFRSINIPEAAESSE